MREEMIPCLAESPHQIMVRPKGQKPYRKAWKCNRLYGHSGNHMWGTINGYRQREWTQDGKVVR